MRPRNVNAKIASDVNIIFPKTISGGSVVGIDTKGHVGRVHGQAEGDSWHLGASGSLCTFVHNGSRHRFGRNCM